MIPIIAGMTGAEYLTAINNNTKEYNVKDYGALGNGSHDDTEHIQNAINAAVAAGGGIVYFPNGIYIIGGALQTNIGGLNPNSQLYIPGYTYLDSERCGLKFIGESPITSMAVGSITNGGILTNTKGVILKSTLTSASGTLPSVIAPVPKIMGFLNAPWCAIEIEFKNILIYVDALEGGNGPCLNGINGAIFFSSRYEDVTVSIDVQGCDSVLPVANVTGIITGLCNTSWPHLLVNTCVIGFKNGYIVGEHVLLHNVFAYCCETAFVFSAGNYMTTATLLLAHWCKYAIGYVASALYGGNLPAQVNILSLESECYQKGGAGIWYDTAYIVNDPTNKLYGEIHYQIDLSGVPGNDNTQFTKNGGNNLRCYPIVLPVASTTLTGSTDAEKLASVITVLKNLGLAV